MCQPNNMTITWLLIVTVLTVCAGTVLTQKAQHTKVLVLGAGAAGLSAAKTLHENNITDFIILEGSDRIGGRVKSFKFGGKTVEAGANWVATTKDFKLLSDIVAKYKVKGTINDFDSVVIRNAAGENITAQADDVWVRFEAAKEYFMKTAKKLINKGFPDMSLRACMKISGWRPKTPIDDIVEIFDIDVNYGTMPQAIACSQVYVQDVIIDDTFYVNDDRGYEFLLKKHVESAVPPDDERIKLNEVVKKIEHTDSKVTVMTDTGKVLTSDFAIVTFSVGVLQRKLVTFQPPLPDRFTINLARVRQENYVKIYLKFPSKFWDDAEFILFADAEHPRGYYPIWQNPEPKGIFSQGTNILRGIVIGVEGLRVSRLSDEQIKGEAMDVLRQMYRATTVPDPDSMYVTRWETDPLYMGTFCNMPPGALQKNVSYALSTPVDKLYFAGEIYDPVLFGYVSGAIRSGIEVAKKIMKCMKGDCEEYRPQSPQVLTCGSSFIGLSLYPLILSVLLLFML